MVRDSISTKVRRLCFGEYTIDCVGGFEVRVLRVSTARDVFERELGLVKCGQYNFIFYFAYHFSQNLN